MRVILRYRTLPVHDLKILPFLFTVVNTILVSLTFEFSEKNGKQGSESEYAFNWTIFAGKFSPDLLT